MAWLTLITFRASLRQTDISLFVVAVVASKLFEAIDCEALLLRVVGLDVQATEGQERVAVGVVDIPICHAGLSISTDDPSRCQAVENRKFDIIWKRI